MINKIMPGKYYTGSCLSTIITLNYVATPTNGK